MLRPNETSVADTIVGCSVVVLCWAVAEQARNRESYCAVTSLKVGSLLSWICRFGREKARELHQFYLFLSIRHQHWTVLQLIDIQDGKQHNRKSAP